MVTTRLRNQVQLITYPDSLGRNLQELRTILNEHVTDAVGGVHILPFYPSSADRGFAPLTHLKVDPRFGTWEDIEAIGEQYDLMADLVVNHMSCDSEYFQDFIEKGDDSIWRDLFLDVDDLLARHSVSAATLKDTYRPRPTSPIVEFSLADGSKRRLWCTFSDRQVDLDVTKAKTRELLRGFIRHLAHNNVRILRLDAVGYTIKKPKTNSFLIPETYELIRWLKSEAHEMGVEVLTEVHHNYKRQESMLHKRVTDWVYDFALPLLTLHALYTGDTNHLKNWISMRPMRTISTLDTHDGIGVVDVDGLLSPEATQQTLETIQSYGGNKLYRASGKNANNLDIYQINTTYYSALNEHDDKYITARAIQFFLPGIPQVYYVGMLAGRNDFELFESTNHGRDVNRHGYTIEEVASEMQRPVVQRMMHLMRFRNQHPAFDGTFSILPSDVHKLRFRWEIDDLYVYASIRIDKGTVDVEYVNPENGRVELRRF
jgi:sucrose phosphorylase